MIEIFRFASAFECETPVAQRVFEFPTIGHGHQRGGVAGRTAGENCFVGIVVDAGAAEFGPVARGDESFDLINRGEVG